MSQGPAGLTPFLSLHLCVAPGDGHGVGVQPVLAWDQSLTPDQLMVLAAALNVCAEDFARLYPPTDEVVANVATARANGLAIREAEVVVRAAEGGA